MIKTIEIHIIEKIFGFIVPIILTFFTIQRVCLFLAICTILGSNFPHYGSTEDLNDWTELHMSTSTEERMTKTPSIVGRNQTHSNSGEISFIRLLSSSGPLPLKEIRSAPVCHLQFNL